MGTGGSEARITLLGRFAVAVDDVAVPGERWSSRRSGELVQLLSLADDRRLLRDQVIDALWPHLDAHAGAANLRKAAHLARQAIGDTRAVVLRRGEVLLFPERAVVIDAEEFERAATAALAEGAPSACAAAAASYGGELLPGAVYEDWAAARRARLAALHLDCLRAAGQWAAVAAADPLDERAHQLLMQEAMASGRRAQAIRWYGRLRDALAADLGVRPRPETEELYEACIAEPARRAPPLVGRAGELATLRALVDPHSSGGPGGVVLRGPPGIGKSALCAAFAEEARARGASVVSVECRGSPAPYGPVRAAVESLLDASGVPDLPPHTLAVLAALTPAAGPVAPTDGPLSRHQVIGALRRLLLAATSGRPVAVVADDVHDADSATVEALLHLVSPRDPIVLVLAMRPQSTLDRQIGRRLRTHHLAVVEVGPLDASDAAQLAVATAGRPLDDATIAAITGLSAGNPFATMELAGTPGLGAGGRLPADVGRAITDRLVDVDDGEVALLTRLALAGEELDPEMVLTLAGGDDEETAFALLDHALDARVLVVTGERYRFRHDLVRRALVDRIPPHQRRAVHRDVARRLGAAGAAPADVARHWLAGGRPLDAIEPLLVVAGDAVRLGAFAGALDALAPVLAAVPAHPLALRLRAEVLDAQGDVGTVAAYDAAIASAPDAERDDLRAKRALAQLKQGDVPGAVRSLDGVAPTAVDARLAEALTYSGAAALGFVDPTMGTMKSADCRRLALETGDARAIVVASWAGAAAAHARGELRDSVLADLRDTHDLPHLATRVFDGQLCVTQRLLYGARPYDDVISFADALAGEALRLGAARGHAFGVVLRGEAELLSGRLDDAAGDLLDAVRLHRAIGAATGEAHALQRLAELEWYRGDAARADALLDEALDLARATDMGFHLLDRIFGTRLALLEPADALLALDQAEDDVRGALETCPGCRITFAVPAAIAAARGGDVDRAVEYEGAVAFLASVVMRLPAWTAAHHEVRGHIARAQGDRHTARGEFAAAADGFAGAGQPLDHARCAAARDLAR